MNHNAYTHDRKLYMPEHRPRQAMQNHGVNSDAPARGGLEMPPAIIRGPTHARALHDWAQDAGAPSPLSLSGAPQPAAIARPARPAPPVPADVSRLAAPASPYLAMPRTPSPLTDAPAGSASPATPAVQPAPLARYGARPAGRRPVPGGPSAFAGVQGAAVAELQRFVAPPRRPAPAPPMCDDAPAAAPYRVEAERPIGVRTHVDTAYSQPEQLRGRNGAVYDVAGDFFVPSSEKGLRQTAFAAAHPPADAKRPIDLGFVPEPENANPVSIDSMQSTASNQTVAVFEPMLEATPCGIALLQAISQGSVDDFRRCYKALQKAEYDQDWPRFALRLKQWVDRSLQTLPVYIAHKSADPIILFRYLESKHISLEHQTVNHVTTLWALLGRPSDDAPAVQAADWLLRHAYKQTSLMTSPDGVTLLMRLLRQWPAHGLGLWSNLSGQLDKRDLWLVDRAGNTALGDAVVTPRASVLIAAMLVWYGARELACSLDESMQGTTKRDQLEQAALRALMFQPDPEQVCALLTALVAAGARKAAIGELVPPASWDQASRVRTQLELVGLLNKGAADAFANGMDVAAYRNPPRPVLSAAEAREQTVQKATRDALFARSADDLIATWDCEVFHRWVMQTPNKRYEPSGKAQLVPLAHAVKLRQLDAVEMILDLLGRKEKSDSAGYVHYQTALNQRDPNSCTVLMNAIDQNDLRLVHLLLASGAQPKLVRPLETYEQKELKKQNDQQKIWQNMLDDVRCASPKQQARVYSEVEQLKAAYAAKKPSLLQQLPAQLHTIKTWRYDAVAYAIKQKRPAILRHLLAWDENRAALTQARFLYDVKSLESLDRKGVHDAGASRCGREVAEVLTAAIQRRRAADVPTRTASAHSSTPAATRQAGRRHPTELSRTPSSAQSLTTTQSAYTTSSDGQYGAAALTPEAKALLQRAPKDSVKQAQALAAWLYDRGVFCLDPDGKPARLGEGLAMDAERLTRWGLLKDSKLGIKSKHLKALLARIAMDDSELAEALQHRTGHADVSVLLHQLETQLQLMVYSL